LAKAAISVKPLRKEKKYMSEQVSEATEAAESAAERHSDEAADKPDLAVDVRRMTRRLDHSIPD